MKKILLVDDNEHDRVLYKRYLGKSVGHERLEISEAGFGAEALAIFRQVKPDCVLLDYNLPDIDGLDLLAKLTCEVPPDTLCVVMITGVGNETLAVRALTSGALDYLVKQQFDQELLCRTVLHAIEKNEWRQYMGRYHDELQGVNQQLRDSLEALEESRREISVTNARLTAANEQVQVRNAELATTNQQLARTNADLDNFVYAASHDLKQPVNNLCGLFDELRHLADFDDPAAPQLWQLVDNSLRVLSTTITDLATVVQVERQPTEQPAEKVALADLAAEVRQTLHTQIMTSQADVRLDFGGLPTVHYVPSSLRTILLNLLANALKYHHPERVPHIQLRSYLADGRPVLVVQDNGLGIDLETHGAELFQLFRRFHPDTAPGTGVGLFLVNRLVQAQGGHIKVVSQPGEGTTFSVCL